MALCRSESPSVKDLFVDERALAWVLGLLREDREDRLDDDFTRSGSEGGSRTVRLVTEASAPVSSAVVVGGIVTPGVNPTS